MISLTRKVADEEHPEWGRRLAEVMATVHMTDMAALPPELEVPGSWDEYIDGRIQYWEDSERAHIDRDPIMRLRRRVAAGQQAAAGAVGPRPRRLPDRQRAHRP